MRLEIKTSLEVWEGTPVFDGEDEANTKKWVSVDSLMNWFEKFENAYLEEDDVATGLLVKSLREMFPDERVFGEMKENKEL